MKIGLRWSHLTNCIDANIKGESMKMLRKTICAMALGAATLAPVMSTTVFRCTSQQRRSSRQLPIW